MVLQGAMEGIFFDMRDHRKQYPMNMHYLFSALRVVVWLIHPTLENGIWLVLAYPFFHDGAMYSARGWCHRKRRGYSTWRVWWVYWSHNPNPMPYKWKAVFSFRWEVRCALLLVSMVLIWIV